MDITRRHEIGFGRNLVEMLPLDLPELSKPSRNLGNLKQSEKTRTTHFRKIRRNCNLLQFFPLFSFLLKRFFHLLVSLRNFPLLPLSLRHFMFSGLSSKFFPLFPLLLKMLSLSSLSLKQFFLFSFLLKRFLLL